MRKWLCKAVSVTMLLGCIFPQTVYAADEQSQQHKKLETYIQSDSVSALQSDDLYEYVRFVDNTYNDKQFTDILNIVEIYTNTSAKSNKQNDKKILLDLFMLHDCSQSMKNVEQKNAYVQKVYHDNGKDVSKTAVQIAAETTQINDSMHALESNITDAMNGLANSSESTDACLEAIADLQVVLENYAYISQLCANIKEQSEEPMKSAANELKEAQKFMMQSRLNTYAVGSASDWKTWGNYFYAENLLQNCKNTEEYNKNENIKWYIDYAQQVAAKIQSQSDAAKITQVLVSDLSEDGKTLLNRIADVVTVKAIGNTLSGILKDMSDKELSQVRDEKKENEFTQRYITMSELLADCRILGEYSWCTIGNADKALSAAVTQRKGKKPDEIVENVSKNVAEIQKELDKLQPEMITPLSEEELLAIMESAAGTKMSEHVYVDMNHDGASELIGVYSNRSHKYVSWFCSSDGKTCHEITTADRSTDYGKIQTLQVNNETHVAINYAQMMGTDKFCTILRLEKNDIKILVSNMTGLVGMNKQGDICLNVEAYDGSYDKSIKGMIGHSFKNTYLYFDGQNYKEYTATQISESEFLSYENGKDVKDKIEQDIRKSYKQTQSIEFKYYKRKNGIIDVQCIATNTQSIEYGYYTIRYSDNKLDTEIGQYNMGQMSEKFSKLEAVD